MPPDTRLATRLEDFFARSHWYHVIDFGSGLVSRGAYDYRGHLPDFGFPTRLDGKRILDIGAADGFFSFELERRGGSVLAVDTNPFDGAPAIDATLAHRARYAQKYSEAFEGFAEFADVFASAGVPVGHRFLLARTLLGAGAVYRNGSIYDLSALGEKFDVIFCGALIEHLKNPVEAVEQLRGALKPDGLCIVTLSSVLQATVTSRPLVRILRRLGLPIVPVERGATYNGNVSGGSFFHFYAESFRELLLASGFGDVEIHSRFKVRNLRRADASFNHHATFHCRL